MVVMIVQPLFFFVVLGFGLKSIQLPGMESKDYTQFIAPGIIAMSIMSSSMFTGISVLWDKQFGFLQEVLVAPVSRLSIIVGRTIGGATTALFQGLIILFIAFALGIFPASVTGLFLTLVFMVLSAFAAVGFGLVIASKMRDMQGFPLIMNLVIMPLVMVSSAFFKLDTLPSWILPVAQLNPIFYMVDGLRGSLINADNMFPPIVDLLVVSVVCVVMMGLGSYFFSKSET
jgi:ABC-2 type transport system permease protein